MSGWQPIETAPKDGTRIDLWIVDQDGNGWRDTDAYWVVDMEARRGLFDWVRRSGWFAPNHDYDGEDGWADNPEGWTHKTTGKHHFARAAHWMPLPPPPECPSAPHSSPVARFKPSAGIGHRTDAQTRPAGRTEKEDDL